MEIDYVVPMVFHDDPLWRSMIRLYDIRYSENHLMDFVRFRSWGTEELLVKCVRRFMPWVRDIIILLASESQRKEWMLANMPGTEPGVQERGSGLRGCGPRVRVVYHREFMPGWALPTFNSAAIEMFLYRIPGLSERFIYGNDDMYPVSMLEESDFFDGELPCLHHWETEFPESPNTFHLACKSGLNFVAKEFGRKYDGMWLKGCHGMTPMLKKTWEHLWKRGGREIQESVSRFREPKNFYQWICPWWHYLSGQYVDRVPRWRYVSTLNSVEDVVKAVGDRKAQVVCVNDNECVSDYWRYGAAVKAALEERLSRGDSIGDSDVGDNERKEV